MFRLFPFIKRNMLWQAGLLFVFQIEFFISHISAQEDSIKIEHIELQVPISKDSNQILIRQGIVLRRKNAQGTVILCHGYQSDKFQAMFFSRLFPQFNAIAFDFRAHGEQIEGQYSTIGGNEIYEVLAAVDFAKHDAEMKKLPLFAYGYSMGAVSAIGAQAAHPVFDAMILDCPYDSTNAALQRGIGANPEIHMLGKSFQIPAYAWIQKYIYRERARPFMRFVFQHVTKFDPKVIATQYMLVEPAKLIGSIKVPVFLIRCDNDAKVPLQAIMAIYENKIQGFKRLWLTPGRWHCDSYDMQPDEYFYRVNKFVQMVLQHALSKVEQAKIIDDRNKGNGEKL